MCWFFYIFFIVIRWQVTAILRYDLCELFYFSGFICAHRWLIMQFSFFIYAFFVLFCFCCCCFCVFFLSNRVCSYFGIIYASWCLFLRLCLCWFWHDLCELMCIFQVVFLLTSLWFMRVNVCFPGCVSPAFAIIWVDACTEFAMIHSSWCV